MSSYSFFQLILSPPGLAYMLLAVDTDPIIVTSTEVQ